MSHPPPPEAGFRFPAEWTPHDACWTALPFRAEEWSGHLEGAQEELLELCRAIAEVARERVELLVPDETHRARVEGALRDVEGVRVHVLPYGDSWVRDTGPLFLLDPEGALGCVRYRWDGWGGKFRMPGDDAVGDHIAEAAGVEPFRVPVVLEGGAVDVDGRGTCLTSESCLLDGVRNPGLDREAMERALREGLGVTRVIWVRAGLANDHTDGHIDTIARFVAEAEVVCMRAESDDDPNADTLEAIADDLAGAVDAEGRRLVVHRIPSPGAILDERGVPMPASYCNFYIGNEAVIVPTYQSPFDEAAVASLGRLFPGRRVIGRPSRHILAGGGAFHCVTQQQPKGRRR